MVDYKCVNPSCKKTVSGVLVESKIRCPYCNSKILEKVQTRILNSIKAR